MYTHRFDLCNMTVLCEHGSHMTPCPHLFRDFAMTLVASHISFAGLLSSSSLFPFLLNACQMLVDGVPCGLLADFSLSHPSFTSPKLLLPLLPPGRGTEMTSLSILTYLASSPRSNYFCWMLAVACIATHSLFVPSIRLQRSCIRGGMCV
jgi:hypothetical protein